VGKLAQDLAARLRRAAAVLNRAARGPNAAAVLNKDVARDRDVDGCARPWRRAQSTRMALRRQARATMRAAPDGCSDSNDGAPRRVLAASN